MSTAALLHVLLQRLKMTWLGKAQWAEGERRVGTADHLECSYPSHPPRPSDQRPMDLASRWSKAAVKEDDAATQNWKMRTRRVRETR